MFFQKSFAVLSLILLAVCGKTQDTLKLTRLESEALFLQQNLLLIAEKLEISKADALVLQARLWPNPTFTLDQVNFWATPGQTGGQEVSPPFFGNFGRNQQVGAEIEQLILTGRKRSKLVALEQINSEKAQHYFEELVRNLKFEFRQKMTELQFLEQNSRNYQRQLAVLSQLITGYDRQVKEGHIPRGELIRLKALQLELLRNLNETAQSQNEARKQLQLWMRVPATTHLMLTDAVLARPAGPVSALPMAEIAEEARQNRPDLSAAIKEVSFARKQIDYEKAQRVPNVTLKAAYDRNGNTMLNFFGFGAALDLPLFDKNQGNIKYAQHEAEQARTLLDYQTQKVESEVIVAYQNLKNALELRAQIDDDYETALDEMLAAYTKNFTERNVSLLEFLDFMDAWLENKQIILNSEKSVYDKIEELNYAVGRDVL